MTNVHTTGPREIGSGARTLEVDGLRRFRGDAVEGAVMRSNIRGQLFGDDAPPLPRIGALVLRKQLGRGGMGVVFAAWDPRLRRELAIKLISVDRRPDAAGIRDEARAIAAIDHENVVRVFAAGRCRVPGEIHPRVYIAMERIHGLTLRRWVTQRAPGSAAIVDAYRQAAWGLGAAHRAGITHGDFKPDNAMIDAHGRVRTMDFGLAVHRQVSTISDERHHTGEHDQREIVGTPGYMAPELMFGRSPDPRSDQWALCASLYEALVGTLPFGPLGPDVDETPTVPKSIDRHIAAVLRRGLGYAPASRFPSMDALATALSSTRPRRRVTVALGVTAICGAVLVAWTDAPRPCGDQVVLGGAWGDPTRADVRRTLAESASEVTVARPEQLIETLDGYAAELAMELQTTCESTAASRVDDEPRSACLERCRRALQAVAQRLDQADHEHVARARAAIARLPKIEDCADPDAQAFPLPRDPGLARAVQRVRADLAAADAAAELGDGGTAAFLALLERARRLEQPPLVAEIEIDMARHETVMGDPASAAARLEHGHAIAVEHHMDALAARAAVELAMLSVQLRGDVAAAQRWLRVSGAAAAASDDATLGPRLRAVEYELAIAEGHLERAEQLARARLDAALQACPEGCIDTVLALHELAQVSWYLGRGDDALELSSRGHRLSIAELGATHEQSLELAQLRANVLAELGESDESIAVLEEILALRTLTAASDSATVVSTRFALAQALAGHPARAAEAEATYRRVVEDATQGRHEHFVGMATAALGSLYFRRGELASALAADRRAIEILERVHGGGYPQLATLINNHAVHLAAAGDAAGALAAALRAWDMWHAASPEPSPQDAAFQQNIARQLITLTRSEEALPWLERALAVTESEPTSGPGTASRMTMADALLALGRSGQAEQLRVEARRRCAELSVERRAAAKCALVPPS